MKRLLLWSAGTLLALIVAVVLAFRLSPWPSVAIITYAFSKGDKSSEAALEKHVPPGIVTRRNIAYGDGRDEVFDLYYAEKTSGPQPTVVWVHGGGFIGGSKNQREPFDATYPMLGAFMDPAKPPIMFLGLVLRSENSSRPNSRLL